MFITLLYIKQVALIILYLSLPTYLAYLHFELKKEQKEEKSRKDKIVDGILEKASDECPIVFNVSQDKLIERTADEIERRESVKKQFG